ncbi:type III pantothenate kinase [Desulfovermiculus halophilus]|uniref:type III pantothenate kinase n=1 Tax=Desulfovermiculus halophilus TaxID=339722 RepID=UPI0004801E56|nr:type III pantothenate kinase [Desulfovermiculus halophilus]
MQTYRLLLDVGNTNTKLGVSKGHVILNSFVLPTHARDTADTFGLRVMQIFDHLRISPRQVQAWVVSSVVPEHNTMIRKAGEKYSTCPVLFVPDDLPLPLHNRYANPQEVGADRLVTAFAARRLLSTSGLIVIDFGTATTVECIQGHDYLGGLICPGVFSSLGALAGHTAKLPRISLEHSSSGLEIGRSTAESMNQGFLYGFASMIQGLCQQLRGFLTPEVTVVATGGFAGAITPLCSCLDTVREDLLLQGLLMAHQKTEDR